MERVNKQTHLWANTWSHLFPFTVLQDPRGGGGCCCCSRKWRALSHELMSDAACPDPRRSGKKAKGTFGYSDHPSAPGRSLLCEADCGSLDSVRLNVT